MKNFIQKTGNSLRVMGRRARQVLTGSTGSGYVDMAVAILISVVVGALLLGGLYALFGDTVLPTLTLKISSMFDYGGR